MKAVARRWFVRGRVQGVGDRYFAQKAGLGVGLTGDTRNLDDGRGEGYAVGAEEKVDELAGLRTSGAGGVRGRVQGVGYRYFAQKAALGLGLTGYTRNLDDGRVEVYAVGAEEKLDELAGLLHRGPRWSDVHGVTQEEAAVERRGSFEIEG